MCRAGAAVDAIETQLACFLLKRVQQQTSNTLSAQRRMNDSGGSPWQEVPMACNRLHLQRRDTADLAGIECYDADRQASLICVRMKVVLCGARTIRA